MVLIFKDQIGPASTIGNLTLNQSSKNRKTGGSTCINQESSHISVFLSKLIFKTMLYIHFLEHQHQRTLSYFFLPSQKAPLLLIPYHFTIPPTSKNSIFIKILLFSLSLLFLSIQNCLGLISFSWAFQPFIFSQAPSQPLAQSTNTTANTNKHKPTPIKKKIITGADLKPKHDQSKPRPRPRPRPNQTHSQM